MLFLIVLIAVCLALAALPALGGLAIRSALEAADPHER